jgi:uncharacterized protein YyaL (SSP411 family)
LDVVWSEYRPNLVVAFARDTRDAAVPLLADRPPLDGHATAYVCRNFVCELPVTKPEELAAQLKGWKRQRRHGTDETVGSRETPGSRP